MAELGQQLSQPEAGWKRYDDSNSNFLYLTQHNYMTNYSSGYNLTARFWEKEYNIPDVKSIYFKFKGTKLRIIAYMSDDRATNCKVVVDSVSYTMNQRASSSKAMALCFELTNLNNKIHTVSIWTGRNGWYANLVFDAIDIDATGELLPYNLYEFLIKQNNQYYTIKPEYYQNGQFQPLTLEGGEQPNEADYESFGFDDVNDLLIPIQVGEETFKPYDKLDNEFEICVAEDKE